MNKGFTLIELLVVVLIIGILAAIAVPQYQKIVEKAKLTDAIVKGRSLGAAIESYVQTKNTFPTSFADLDITTTDTKIDEATYYDKYYVYYLAENIGGFGFVRITPARDNINATPWVKGYFGYASSILGSTGQGLGTLPEKSMYCTVKGGSSQIYFSICSSFGPKVINSPAGYNYYIMQ